MLYESPRGISEIHYCFPILFDHRILLAPTYHLFNNTHQHLINLMIYLNTYIYTLYGVTFGQHVLFTRSDWLM